MFSEIPRSASSAYKRPSNRGFTLIELLMVIAVIAILSAITFGISQGVNNARGRTQAKAELAVIAQALEVFKSSNGDYPWASGGADDAEDNGEILFQALVGWMEFERSGETTEFAVKETVSSSGPRAYTDISKLTYVDLAQLGEFNPEIDMSSAPSNHVFLDPWGHPYVFIYGKTGTSSTWDVFGYHLYSTGADEVQLSSVVDSTTGVMEPGFREAGEGENLDNIYSGE